MIRKFTWELLRKLGTSQTGRSILKASLSGYIKPPSELWKDISNQKVEAYGELGHGCSRPIPSMRGDIVIITARFRSGSTFLWNIFRNIEGCTSYFEPLHESRPFVQCHLSPQIDPSHRGVADYWSEYKQLPHLADHFRDDWHGHHYLMSPDYWDEDLQRYVEIMIESAQGIPVLQFNRIDFRLPWFRKHFPNAKTIHLYRHPRDQWCSTIVDNTHPDRRQTRVRMDTTFDQFVQHDYHDLLLWANDLKFHFPFLNEERLKHPYQTFYFIWKLSYLFGSKYSHYSFAFENLVTNFETQLNDLMTASGITGYDSNKLKQLVTVPEIGKWKKFADNAWFQEHEDYCESVLTDFFK